MLDALLPTDQKAAPLYEEGEGDLGEEKGEEKGEETREEERDLYGEREELGGELTGLGLVADPR